MTDQLIARRYGKALYSVCLEQSIVNLVEKELIEFTSMINLNQDLYRILMSPRISSDKKKEVLQYIFSSARLSQVTFNFISLLIDKKRENLFSDIAAVFSEIILENSNIVVAYVTTAFPLSVAEQKLLDATLSAKIGKFVKMEINIDPSIIGGLIIKIEDKVFDGSLMSHLNRIEQEMSGIL
jgi:F-type H+-transporting ATPase subunit delta